jgi:MarR family 2-MHQ and catechol resistance regulon transcriptional repressor
VVRKSTLADRRARLLALTPKGRKLIASVYREHAADLESVVSVLNEEEKDALYRLLKKLGHFAAETLAVRQEEPTSKGRK